MIGDNEEYPTIYYFKIPNQSLLQFCDPIIRFRHPDYAKVTKQYVDSVTSLPVSGKVRRCDAIDMIGKKYRSLKVYHSDTPQRKQYRLKSTMKKNVCIAVVVTYNWPAQGQLPQNLISQKTLVFVWPYTQLVPMLYAAV